MATNEGEAESGCADSPGAHRQRGSSSSYQPVGGTPRNVEALETLEKVRSQLSRSASMSEILTRFRAQRATGAKDVSHVSDRQVATLILTSHRKDLKAWRAAAQLWVDERYGIGRRTAVTDASETREAQQKAKYLNICPTSSPIRDDTTSGAIGRGGDMGTRIQTGDQPSPREHFNTATSPLPQGSMGPTAAPENIRGRRSKNTPAEQVHGFGPVDPSLSDILGQALGDEDWGQARDGKAFLETSPESKRLTVLSNSSLEQLASHVQALRLDYLQDTMRPMLANLVSKLPGHQLVPDYVRGGLRTIRARLNSSGFMSMEAFATEVKLILRQSKKDRLKATRDWAAKQKRSFDIEFSHQRGKIHAIWKRNFNHRCDHCDGMKCALCGEKCLERFKAPPIACCRCTKRIQTGCCFHVTRDGSHAWCRNCFSKLPEYPFSRAGDDTGGGRSSGVGDVLGTSGGTAALDSNEQADSSTTTHVAKRDLLNRRKVETTNCKWVQCGVCDRWVHTVCALLNGSANGKDENTAFFCPVCRLRAGARNVKRPAPPGTDRKEAPKSPKRVSDPTADDATANDAHAAQAASTSASASETEISEPAVVTAVAGEDLAAEVPTDAINVSCHPLVHVLDRFEKMYRTSSLPHTPLSTYLEGRVRARLTERGEGVEAEALSVRLLSNTDATFDTPDVFRTIFKTEDGLGEGLGKDDVPKVVRYRSKVIAMFQRIGADDVYVFSMYTQECDEQAPYFNQRRGYIAYVDSVDYTRVKNRSAAYKEILVGYLEWLRHRGFKFVHLWICRPKYGDSFVFWIRPRFQKIPEQIRLTEWYWNIAQRAIKLGVASKATSLCEIAPFNQGQSVSDTSASVACGSGNCVDRRLHVPALFDGDYLEQQAIELAKNLGAAEKTEYLPQALSQEVRRMGKRLMVIDLEPPGMAGVPSGGITDDIPITEVCRALTQQLEMLSPDGQDPDLIISRPLVDNLDVFLKTCQLRHYQFDTLVRAKHSTAMILYHIHDSGGANLDSFCRNCPLPLRLVRYHCAICDTDRCSACEKASDGKCGSGHLLVPYQLPSEVEDRRISGGVPASDDLAQSGAA